VSDKEIGWLWLPAHTEVKVGQTLTAEGLEYVSPRALDALQRYPGTTICRIDQSGTVLAMADATTVLHEFACWSAEQALLGERKAGREPDKRSWAAIETKRKWLRGEATDEELDAAWDAAWDAQEEATYAASATSDAAASAANAAARGAAWAATWAACSAAWAATWTVTAAWAATWTVTAAWDTRLAATAAWDAARDATWAAQNAKLEEMLNDLLKEVEEK